MVLMIAYGFSIKSSFNDTIIEGHLDVEKKRKICMSSRM